MRPFIILFTAFLTFSGGAFALSMASIIKQAEVIKVNAVTAATSTAITVSTTIRGFAANDPYQIKSLDVPKATYMTRFKAGMGETGGLKGLLKRNAWYAGWAATMFAAGWAIDELTNQVVSTSFPLPMGGYVSTLEFRYISTGGVYASFACSTTPPLTFTACLNSLKYSPLPKSQPVVVNNGGLLQVTYPSIDLMDERFSPSMLRPGLKITFNLYGTTSGDFNSEVAVVSDDSLYDSLITQMLQDPDSSGQAFMAPDAWPYPYPEVFPDTVPYIPGVTQSDQELLDLYAQGLLQSTNPNAAHYVSPEKLAEIAALAGQLQAGVTPQALVDAANQAAQAPVTQAQLEELMKKQEAAEAKADAAALEGAKAALAPATTALDQLNDEKSQLEDMISDSPTANPPSSIPDIFDWTLPTGNCQPYPFTFTIQAGSAQADDDGAFCRTYNEVAHPLIFWFLNMLTAVYIFGIWSRTMTSVVGGR